MQDPFANPDHARHVSPSNRLSRRAFLRTMAGAGISLAGFSILAACGSPLTSSSDISTRPLETTRLRMAKGANICPAPTYLAQPFFKEEGFTDISYLEAPNNNSVEQLSSGQLDMLLQFSGPLLTILDVGKPITVLAGVHIGCFVLFGSERVNTIADLKGKTLTINAFDGPDHAFLSSMLAYVGLDPNTDVTWNTVPTVQGKQLFMDGKTDAFLAFPPVAQELEAKKIGHVVVNSMTDDPWSQYYCCMVTANRDFAFKYPEATKRALRAILKATDLCALHPEQAARFLVDNGNTPNYEYALQAMREIPYNHWRVYDPEDSLRFYALRLHDVGMIKNNPNDLIAAGTNWSFLNQLKTELKTTAAVPQYYCKIQN